nr:putative disease resistance protein RGA3 [Ipomoea batatas]GME15700.1 putative disease resistance protein RGA3 [Ipomoea batatas]
MVSLPQRAVGGRRSTFAVGDCRGHSVARDILDLYVCERDRGKNNNGKDLLYNNDKSNNYCTLIIFGFESLETKDLLEQFSTFPLISTFLDPRLTYLSLRLSGTESSIAMADAIASKVVEDLYNFMKDKFQQELRAALGVEKEIQNLSSKLNKIRQVLDDAERKSFKEKHLKLWLQDIQAFCYDVEDVLD